MALRVIEHYPTINAVDIPRNAQIWIKFNNPLVPQSIDYTHFSVNDAGTYSTLPGTVGVEYISGLPYVMTYTPLLNMLSVERYRVYVFRAPNSVVDTENNQLTETYTFEFTTGTGLLDVVPSGGTPSGVYSGVIDTSQTLTITDTTPKDHQPNYSASCFKVTFSHELDLTDTNLYDYISITSKDVLE
jgi:hypothetical protein